MSSARVQEKIEIEKRDTRFIKSCDVSTAPHFRRPMLSRVGRLCAATFLLLGLGLLVGLASPAEAQMAELTGDKSVEHKQGFHTISDIAKERIRRVGSKIGETLTSGLDIGVRVFKLSETGLRIWKPDRTDLENTLLENTEKIDASRTEHRISSMSFC